MHHTPYNGLERKLVLAFDIGTSDSSVSFASLDPGKVPQIKSVTRYFDNPGIGSAWTSSTLYYDRKGNFRGVENGTGLQDDESLIQMRWKLMLELGGPAPAPRDCMSRDLPMGKTIVDLFSDFMRYLFDSTKSFFVAIESNGEFLWNSATDNIELVLTHPSGWGGPQRDQLRTAAVRANIIPDTPEGHARIHFLTEGEAKFSFCATQTQVGETLKFDDRVIVIDAGNQTIDINFYRVTNNTPLRIEELLQPKWGRLSYSESKGYGNWQKSRFNTSEDIAAFAQKFDEGLKYIFSDDNQTNYVRFGSPRDNDPRIGVKGGRKAVSGFFEPSIQSTVDCIGENFTENLPMNSFAFLIGEFASSPWLAHELNRRLSNLGLKVIRPEFGTGILGRAVAIGAVSSYIDQFTKGRIARFTYGTASSTFYKPTNPEHIKRKHKTFIDELGHTCVPDGYVTMLSKGTWILETQELRKKLRVVREGGPGGSGALVRIIKYDGKEREPKWMDIEPDKFETLCQVVADISAVPPSSILGSSGAMRYHYEFDMVLFMGLPEMRAQIRWVDYSTGEEKSVEAEIVYEDVS
ncbi:hypothetical protein BJ322DRAFT_1110093 [Thelephora terrestris]|uniref:Uncharacterized protein n=1 Tax=Thelephora terrestris TaxID=56493 RepID=A0A9P6L599_9AGAM|nr:hypothetical protein BJ322DRAFT_1110093 [Thelephora terrestris]